MNKSRKIIVVSCLLILATCTVDAPTSTPSTPPTVATSDVEATSDTPTTSDNPTSTEASPITPPPTQTLTPTEPEQLDPDDSELLVHQGFDGGSLTITRLDGTVTETVSTSGWDGRFSPDGSRVAFVEFVDTEAGEATRLGVFDREAGTTVLSGPAEGFFASPLWSPSGTQLLASSILAIGDSGASSRLKLVTASTLEHFDVVEPNGRLGFAVITSPSWAAAENRIVAIDLLTETAFSTNDAGSDRVDIELGQYPVGVQMSPDGLWLAIVAKQDRDDSQSVLSVVSTGGTNLIPLVRSSESMSLITWSPDGQLLAYLSDQALNIVAIDGTEVAAVPIESVVAPPVWSPDSSHVALSNQEATTLRVSEFKVVLIGIDGTVTASEIQGIVSDWRQLDEL